MHCVKSTKKILARVRPSPPFLAMPRFWELTYRQLLPCWTFCGDLTSHLFGWGLEVIIITTTLSAGRLGPLYHLVGWGEADEEETAVAQRIWMPPNTVQTTCLVMRRMMLYCGRGWWRQCGGWPWPRWQWRRLWWCSGDGDAIKGSVNVRNCHRLYLLQNPIQNLMRWGGLYNCTCTIV